MNFGADFWFRRYDRKSNLYAYTQKNLHAQTMWNTQEPIFISALKFQMEYNRRVTGCGIKNAKIFGISFMLLFLLL